MCKRNPLLQSTWHKRHFIDSSIIDSYFLLCNQYSKQPCEVEITLALHRGRPRVQRCLILGDVGLEPEAAAEGEGPCDLHLKRCLQELLKCLLQAENLCSAPPHLWAPCRPPHSWFSPSGLPGTHFKTHDYRESSIPCIPFHPGVHF